MAVRSTPLTRNAVVAAGIALVDRDGLGRLSMRALAASLGVEAMSLYNHVRNKDDLIDAMVDVVVSEITRPDDRADWRGALRERALSMRAVFTRHPWAPQLISGRLNTGPNMLALFDATIGCLHAAGCDYPEADRFCNAMDSLIYGFHVLEQSFPIPPDQYSDAARTFLPQLDPQRLPHLHAMAVMVAEQRHSGLPDFGLAVDLILDAIARRIASA